MKHVSLWTVWMHLSAEQLREIALDSQTSERIKVHAITRLRLKIWWMFGVDAWAHHNVKDHRLNIRPFLGQRRYWSWTVIVQKGRIEYEHELGPLQQWTIQEALSLAARKAEWVLHPEQEPVREPEPNPETPKHGKMYRLEDHGKVAIECYCGWRASTLRCHPELDSPRRCMTCAVAEDLYQQHFESSQTPQEAVSQ